MRSKQLDILYVEDDEMDVDLAKTTLADICGADQIQMQVVEDGEKALQFLNKSEPYHDAITPDVILLDLNLPKVHGRDVLRTIKQAEQFKKIPVIILTTSQRQDDVDESYRLGASGFLTKPSELKEYQETFKAICDYWFRRVALPSKAVTTDRLLPK